MEQGKERKERQGEVGKSQLCLLKAETSEITRTNGSKDVMREMPGFQCATAPTLSPHFKDYKD